MGFPNFNPKQLPHLWLTEGTDYEILALGNYVAHPPPPAAPRVSDQVLEQRAPKGFLSAWTTFMRRALMQTHHQLDVFLFECFQVCVLCQAVSCSPSLALPPPPFHQLPLLPPPKKQPRLSTSASAWEVWWGR